MTDASTLRLATALLPIINKAYGGDADALFADNRRALPARAVLGKPVGERKLAEDLKKTMAPLYADASEGDVAAAVELVAEVLGRYGMQPAGVAAIADPEGLLERLAALDDSPSVDRAGSVHATFDRALQIAVTILAQYAPKAAYFVPAALSDLLPQARCVAAAVGQANAKLDGLLKALRVDDDLAILVPAMRQAGARLRQQLHPGVLPAVNRTDELASHLANRHNHYPLVVLGDGGMGKSVLAGQIYDRFDAAGEKPILVLATRIPPGTPLGTQGQVLTALASAALDTDDQPHGLDQILQTSPVDHPIIVDTLDIVLNEDTAKIVGRALQALTRSHRVIVTCRDREWRDLDPLPAGVAATWLVPPLTSKQIIEWCQRYQQRNPGTVTQDFLGQIRVASTRPGTTAILGVPLRLAMACDLYGTTTLPENLTVSNLYWAYWEQRVAVNRQGQKGKTGTQQERAALAIARDLWQNGKDRFVESVGLPDDADAAAFDTLVSEGVVRREDPLVRFFHQTFAEFAMAQHLTRSGKRGDLQHLHDRLEAGEPLAWGIAGYLLGSWLTAPTYRQLAASIPHTSQGVRLLMRGARDRTDLAESTALLQGVAQDARPEAIKNVDVLGDVPDEQLAATVELVAALLDGDGITSPVVSVFTSLLRRMPHHARPLDALPALDRILDQGATTPAETVSLCTRLVGDGLGDAFDSLTVTALTDRYGRLPAPVQKLLLERAGGASLQVRADLLSTALQYPVPEGAVEPAAVELVLAVWRSQRREQLPWARWQDLVTTQHPERWDAVRLRVIAALAHDDDDVRSELLGEAFQPAELSASARTVVNNAAEFVATHDPERTAAAILHSTISLEKMAVSTAASMAGFARDQIADPTRIALADRLRPLACHAPTDAWPAVVKLAAGDDTTLRAMVRGLLDDIANGTVDAANAPKTCRNCVRALIQACNLARLVEIQSLLDELISRSMDRDETAVEAAAAVAAVVPDARNRIAAAVAGRKSKLAATAARKIAGHLQAWTDNEIASHTAWLVGLLGTSHESAARSIAAGIHSNVGRIALAATQTETIVERLLRSIDRREDSQVAAALRDILVAASKSEHRAGTAGSADVTRVLDAYIHRITAELARNPVRDCTAALWAEYNATISALALPTLPEAEMSLLMDALLGIDSGPIAARSVRFTANTIKAYLDAYPYRWEHLEANWPTYPGSTRQAIAEALNRAKPPDYAGMAARLAIHPATGGTLSAILAKISESA